MHDWGGKQPIQLVKDCTNCNVAKIVVKIMITLYHLWHYSAETLYAMYDDEVSGRTIEFPEEALLFSRYGLFDYFGDLGEVFGKSANGVDVKGWYVTPMVHADAVAYQRIVAKKTLRFFRNWIEGK